MVALLLRNVVSTNKYHPACPFMCSETFTTTEYSQMAGANGHEQNAPWFLCLLCLFYCIFFLSSLKCWLAAAVALAPLLGIVLWIWERKATSRPVSERSLQKNNHLHTVTMQHWDKSPGLGLHLKCLASRLVQEKKFPHLLIAVRGRTQPHQPQKQPWRNVRSGWISFILVLVWECLAMCVCVFCWFLDSSRPGHLRKLSPRAGGVFLSLFVSLLFLLFARFAVPSHKCIDDGSAVSDSVWEQCGTKKGIIVGKCSIEWQLHLLDFWWSNVNFVRNKHLDQNWLLAH